MEASKYSKYEDGSYSRVSRGDLKRRARFTTPLTLFRPRTWRAPRARAKKKGTKGRRLSARKIAVAAYDGEGKSEGTRSNGRRRETGWRRHEAPGK